MSAFMKAQKLLGDTHDMLAQERDREQRLVHVHSEAEFKAIADLLAGGAQPSETGFHLRVADKVWDYANRIRECRANIKRLEDRALTLREVLYGQED